MKSTKLFNVILMSSIAITAWGGSECFEDPGIENAPDYKGSNMSKEGQTELSKQKMDEGSDPPMEALMCAMQAAIEGPHSLLDDNCGCLQVIEDNCYYGWEDGVPVVQGLHGVPTPHCIAFAPVYLSGY